MNKHLMIDIETLSTHMNAVVVSIGALFFDPFTGEIGEKFYVELDLDEQPSRHISVDTFRFWVKQIRSDTYKGEIFIDGEKAPVLHTLKLLQDFIRRNADGNLQAVWACDPDFDCAILSNLFAEYRREVPWAFYHPKSVRTVRMLAYDANVDLPRDIVTHNALQDCVRQANEVITFYQALAGFKAS